MDGRTDAYILFEADYKERDVLLDAVTPQGKMRFLARGLNSPSSKNRYALQIYSHSLMEYAQRGMSGIRVLKTASLIDSFRCLREDLDLQAVAAVMGEIIRRLPDGADLYALTEKAWDALRESGEPLTVLSWFTAQILKREGDQPFVDGCAHCGRTDQIISLSVAEGGFLCRNCAPLLHGKVYPPQILRGFRILNKAGMDDLEKILGRGLNSSLCAEILLDFVEMYTAAHLSSRRFFDAWAAGVEGAGK